MKIPNDCSKVSYLPNGRRTAYLKLKNELPQETRRFLSSSLKYIQEVGEKTSVFYSNVEKLFHLLKRFSIVSDNETVNNYYRRVSPGKVSVSKEDIEIYDGYVVVSLNNWI